MWAAHLPEEAGCPACATGWHTRCRQPDLADDGDGELVERCCDGLLISPPPPTPVDPGGVR